MSESQQPLPDGLDDTDVSEQESAVPSADETIALLHEEIASLKDKAMRALAEVDNIRKRSDREKHDAVKYAAAGFARDLLSVADNFHRALLSVPATHDMPDAVKTFVTGIEMTAKELEAVFAKHGIQRIDPLGADFDHNLHQAMVEIDSEEHEAGKIAQVMQHGYQMHDRLLRPALVGVAKKK